MDHLQVPVNAVRPSIEVPYLAGEPFDGQVFFHYARRKGYEILDRGYFHHVESDDSLLAFYQSWLYFGLMATVLGIRIDPNDFVRQSTSEVDKRVISTAGLRPLVADWLARVRGQATREAQESLAFTTQHLRFALCQCDILESYGQPRPQVWSEVILSIKVLIETLWPFFIVTDSGSWQPRHQHFTYIKSPESRVDFPSATIITEHMISNGWCPWRLHHLTMTCQYITLYYLACLPQGEGQHRSHRTCIDARMCVGDSVDPSKPFRCHHTADCDQIHCQPQSVSSDQVTSIIRQGGIPLIKCKRKGQKISLDVVEAQGNSDYTAITHVWADGLGNSEENSIAACQLNRLIRQLESLPTKPPTPEKRTAKDPLHKSQSTGLLQHAAAYVRSALGLPVQTLFWLDVLCVPTQQKSPEMKAAAISRMTPTYAGARRVLVLESQFQETACNGMLPLELTARLVRSPWMGRSWTLQEGSLAEDLILQVEDGYIHFQTLQEALGYRIMKARQAIDSATDGLNLINDLIRMLYFHSAQNSVFSLIDSKTFGSHERVFQLCEVWNNFLGRSTTKVEDTHSIMANMLDFNSHDILRLPPEKRIKFILCAQQWLPQNLLFMDTPRLVSDCELDRWVPSHAGRSYLEIQRGERSFVEVIPGVGLAISPKQLLHFRIPSNAACHSEFCLIDSGSGWRLWVKVHSAGMNRDLSNEEDSGVLIVEHNSSQALTHYPLARGMIGEGAILSNATFEDHQTTGIFESSITYGHWTLARPKTDSQEFYTIVGQRVKDPQIVIVRTEIPTASRNLHRRPFAFGSRPGILKGSRPSKRNDRLTLVCIILLTIIAILVLLLGALVFHNVLVFVGLALMLLPVIVQVALGSLFGYARKAAFRDWQRSFHEGQPVQLSGRWHTRVANLGLPPVQQWFGKGRKSAVVNASPFGFTEIGERERWWQRRRRRALELATLD